MGVNEFIRIGSRIKKLRQEKNIKQKEMAAILNLPISTYSSYENNHREPSKEIIQKISEVLNVTVPYLLYDELNDSNTDDLYMQQFIDYCHTVGYSIEACLSDENLSDKYYVRKLDDCGNLTGETYIISVKQFDELLSACNAFTKFAFETLINNLKASELSISGNYQNKEDDSDITLIAAHNDNHDEEQQELMAKDIERIRKMKKRNNKNQ